MTGEPPEAWACRCTCSACYPAHALTRLRSQVLRCDTFGWTELNAQVGDIRALLKLLDEKGES